MVAAVQMRTKAPLRHNGDANARGITPAGR
jgi:hypothetical protein